MWFSSGAGGMLAAGPTTTGRQRRERARSPLHMVPEFSAEHQGSIMAAGNGIDGSARLTRRAMLPMRVAGFRRGVVRRRRGARSFPTVALGLALLAVASLAMAGAAGPPGSGASPSSAQTAPSQVFARLSLLKFCIFT